MGNELSDNNHSDNDKNKENSSDDEENYNRRKSTDKSVDDVDILPALKQWAKDNVIAYTHFDALLKILKPHIPKLPLSSRTIMKTNRRDLQFTVRKFNPQDSDDKSEFIYFGIEKNLKAIVNPSLHKNFELTLQFHVVKLLLFNKLKKYFWPILGKIDDDTIKYEPFLIAVWFGTGDPNSPHFFLDEFIKELNSLLLNDIYINGQCFKIHVKCFVCDQLVRSFLKCVDNDVGCHSCERCTATEPLQIENQTMIIAVNCEKRTNASFKSQQDLQHHTGVSPLLLITPEINMIDQFILDFKDLGCTVMKKMMETWIKPNNTIKLDRLNILRLSQRLMNLSHQIPSDFSRSTRSLGEISEWTASDYQLFLLYIGPLVLKDILPPDLYRHFLLLSVGCRILCSEEYCMKYIGLAQTYLKKFVDISKKIYGPEAEISSIHSLLHLNDDVKNMNCHLTKITSFPFGDKLERLKNWVRSGNSPLSQVSRQFVEELSSPTKPEVLSLDYTVKCGRRTDDKLHLSSVRNKHFELTCKAPDNYVLLKRGYIVKIEKMVNNVDSNKIHAWGRKLIIKSDAFDYPTKSSDFNIYKVKETQDKIKLKIEEFLLSQVQCKVMKLLMFELPTDEKEEFIVPLIH